MPTVSKAKKKVAEIRDSMRGLNFDGQSVKLRNKKDARVALERISELTVKADKLRQKLAPIDGDIALLRKALNNYQVENEIKEIKHNGWVSALIERTKSFWVFAESDIPTNLDTSEEITPLLNILKVKFPDVKRRAKIINKITRRTIDPIALDEFVKSGKLSAEDVAPAFVQVIDTSYVTIREENKR